MSLVSRFRLVLVAIFIATPQASHSFFTFPPYVAPVVEFYNVRTGHYFMTIEPSEADAIDSGSAGPGWVRTGLSFQAQTYSQFNVVNGVAMPVARFHAPGPNTHFFTIDEAEAAALKQPGSGWVFEGYPFRASPPGSDGGCGTATPVYRFYNNRFAQNDSNHRFVTSEAERASMRAQGWIDEGVKFCAYGANSEEPIRSFVFSPALWEGGKIQPSAVCEDESRNLGACMAVNNLVAPTTVVPSPFGRSPLVYGDTSGLNYASPYITAPLPDEVAVRDVFVQQNSWTYGVHVDTLHRGSSMYSSVNPLYQLRTTVDPGAFDTRFFPFSHNYLTDAQISVKFVANVRKVNVRSAGSHAYGHPTLEFIDQRSGHHVYFTTLAYGTINGGDFVAPDVATGKVIVATTFRNDSPYIRNLATWTFATPSGFTPENPWGRGGPFEYRMDRTEFARVIAAARGADPALSPAVEDYLLDNFHFTNEVYGDGEIGMNLGGFRLEILRR